MNRSTLERMRENLSSYVKAYIHKNHPTYLSFLSRRLFDRFRTTLKRHEVAFFTITQNRREKNNFWIKEQGQ